MKRTGGLALDDPDVDTVVCGVPADAVAALRVTLDGDRSGPEAGALHGDRAASGAHVPDEVSGTGAEPGEDEGTGFGFGDHSGAVLELSFGQCPTARRWGGRGPPLLPHRPRRVVDQDDVGVLPPHRRHLLRAALVHPLFGLPELLGDEEGPAQALQSAR